MMNLRVFRVYEACPQSSSFTNCVFASPLNWLTVSTPPPSLHRFICGALTTPPSAHSHTHPHPSPCPPGFVQQLQRAPLCPFTCLQTPPDWKLRLWGPSTLPLERFALLPPCMLPATLLPPRSQQLPPVLSSSKSFSFGAAHVEKGSLPLKSTRLHCGAPWMAEHKTGPFMRP
eukprot:1142553-Pelagomonas_calceolata.AAC.5